MTVLMCRSVVLCAK